MFPRVLITVILTVTGATGSGLPPGYDIYTGEKTETGRPILPEYSGEGPADVFLGYKIAGITDSEKPAVLEELIPVLKIRAAGLAKRSKIERANRLGDISVTLTDCPDPERARNVLGAPALLEFRAVAESPTLPELLGEKASDGFEYSVDDRGYVRFAETDWDAFRAVAEETGLPSDNRLVYTRPSAGNVGALLIANDGMVVDEVRDAVFVEDPAGGPMVTFDLDVAGRQEFAGLTARHVGGEIAIIFDGYVMYKGQVAERIEGLANIENVTTREEAEDIALLLRSGSLPARLELTEWYVNGLEMDVPNK
jgi:preprotein translocase subunit SecD